MKVIFRVPELSVKVHHHVNKLQNVQRRPSTRESTKLYITTIIWHMGMQCL